MSPQNADPTAEEEAIFASVWNAAERAFVGVVNLRRHVVDPVPWDAVHPTLKPIFRQHIRDHGHPWRVA